MSAYLKARTIVVPLSVFDIKGPTREELDAMSFVEILNSMHDRIEASFRAALMYAIKQNATAQHPLLYVTLMFPHRCVMPRSFDAIVRDEFPGIRVCSSNGGGFDVCFERQVSATPDAAAVAKETSESLDDTDSGVNPQNFDPPVIMHGVDDLVLKERKPRADLPENPIAAALKRIAIDNA